ncbi:MAG: hypothetical protein JO038_06290 [Alphaproteobacteria bacterium]|nr:hypothetical protein [Alphaproteobacteria bacterium]
MDGDVSIAGPGERGRPFRKGESGNPAGRRPGCRNRATREAEILLEGEAPRLTRKAIELALAGNERALRLCLERLIAPRRERAVAIDLPPVESAADLGAAVGAIAAALRQGAITPREAVAAAQVIAIFVRAIETSDFERRLDQLETATRMA